MSHCAPEATLKPKRFEFTPKIVITDVFLILSHYNSTIHLKQLTDLIKDG